MYRTLLFIFAAIAVILGLLIGVFNAQRVELDIFWVQLDWPLGLLIVLAFVIGLLAGILALYVVRVWPMRMTIRNLRKIAPPAPPAVSRQEQKIFDSDV